MARTDRPGSVDKRPVTLTERQWEHLAPFVAKTGASLEVRFLGSATGMRYSTANELIVSLHRDGVADLYRFVYHVCAEVPAGRRRFENGFQPVPWMCPECEEEVVDSGELQYALQAVLLRPLEKSDFNITP